MRKREGGAGGLPATIHGIAPPHNVIIVPTRLIHITVAVFKCSVHHCRVKSWLVVLPVEAS
ncbi:hypothetical protein M8C21_018117 [Ambrosia artemisiifolia]|uniref:Uncharacterized protein n=1 Tax=Ambrosia artemisiifolia TaxID=4212 RepID=A0AAD5CTA1_AMBAR|nr:hypothetical protein M8C21_018117 [Ambrosia artemisiifolia]